MHWGWLLAVIYFGAGFLAGVTMLYQDCVVERCVARSRLRIFLAAIFMTLTFSSVLLIYFLGGVRFAEEVVMHLEVWLYKYPGIGGRWP